MKRLSKFLVLVPVIFALSACAHQRNRDQDRYGGYGGQPGVYSSAGSPQQVHYGSVRNIEQIEVGRGKQASGGGALAGAVIGGVVGNQMGSGNGRAAMTMLGALGGAIAGDAIERDNNGGDRRQLVYRVRVRLDTGGEVQFDFQDLAGMKVGDRVRVEGGRLQRL